MAFKESFRIERVYFERLKSLIPLLKSFIDNAQTEEARLLLENSVDVDGAVLLLYRNIGEAWAELADLIQKLRERLDEEHDLIEQYHDELNEKIDEVNNYIMAIIREILARLDVIEHDLATMNRVKFLDLVETSGVYSLELNGEPVDFEDVAELIDFPHLVLVRAALNGKTSIFYSDSTTTAAHVWKSYDFSNNAISETTITQADIDAVTVATETQVMPSAGFGILISNAGVISVDPSVIQEKLTAGDGIEIDNDNVISVTAKGLFVVTVTETGASSYSSNKTFDEIIDAYNSGSAIEAHLIFAGSSDVSIYPLVYVFDDETDGVISFADARLDEDSANIIFATEDRINIYPDERVEFVVTDATKPTVYTAGRGISIDGNNNIGVISPKDINNFTKKATMNLNSYVNSGIVDGGKYIFGTRLLINHSATTSKDTFMLKRILPPSIAGDATDHGLKLHVNHRVRCFFPKYGTLCVKDYAGYYYYSSQANVNQYLVGNDSGYEEDYQISLADLRISSSQDVMYHEYLAVEVLENTQNLSANDILTILVTVLNSSTGRIEFWT